MGFRLSRRIRLFPGVRLNVSKSGVSASLGRRGAWLTVGPRGTRATVGLPGTGVSYTTTSPSSSHHETAVETPTDAEVRLHPVWAWLGIILAIAAVVAIVRARTG
ncbi:MAG: hypothetical protein JWN63_2820 [Candidatus Acidoferrum typicum]|nr:hypothetical protein [Candidatus Acidoferrum typicum]